MKILKEGEILDNIEIFKLKCNKCNTLFEATEYELHWTSHSMFDVACPICGVELTENHLAVLPTKENKYGRL